jgi:hypothetical protein
VAEVHRMSVKSLEVELESGVQPPEPPCMGEPSAWGASLQSSFEWYMVLVRWPCAAA